MSRDTMGASRGSTKLTLGMEQKCLQVNCCAFLFWPYFFLRLTKCYECYEAQLGLGQVQTEDWPVGPSFFPAA